MKLYIPTSSLNIENILSTESISPYSFYAKREFGYNRFYPIYDYDAILLFPDIPTFTVEYTGMQCFPVIIEVNINLESNKNIRKISPRSKKVEIYECKETIFLQPNITRILFYDEVALRYTKLNCDDSALNKLASFWKFGIIEQDDKNNIKLSDIIKKLPKQKIESVEPFKDNNYNRVKGFIYGYILGEIMSKPKEIALMLSKQKRIYDIVSAINSGTYNYQFTQELETLDREYSELDPTTSLLKQMWKDEIKTELGIDSNKFDEYLRKYKGIEADIKKQFSKQNGITVRKTYAYFGQLGVAQYIAELNMHISKLLEGCKENNLQNLNIAAAFDLQPDFSRVMMSGEDEISMLFNKVLSRIIWADKIIDAEKIRIDKFKLAEDIVTIIRTIYEDLGEVWNGSTEQQYFHQLRCSIQDFSTQFDINNIDNVVLQSMAAIIRKGNDYREMKSYLESVGFTDYKYVMGLWGAIIGYVSITREVFRELSDSSLFTNIFEAISSIYGVNGEPLLEVYKEEINSNTSLTENSYDDTKTALEQALDNNKFKKKQKEAILKEYDKHKSISKLLIEAVSKVKGIGEKSIQRFTDICRNLTRENESAQSIITTEPGNQSSIFNALLVYFYNDPRAWDHIKKELHSKYHDEVKSDFDFFIKEISKPQNDRKYYKELDEKNNKIVIEKFCNLKSKKSDDKSRPTREDIKRLKDKLFRIYGVK